MSEDQQAYYRARAAISHAKESWKKFMREATVILCDEVMNNPIDATHAISLAADVQAEFDRLFAEQPLTRRLQNKFFGKQLVMEGFVGRYKPLPATAGNPAPSSVPVPAYDGREKTYNICSTNWDW